MAKKVEQPLNTADCITVLKTRLERQMASWDELGLSPAQKEEVIAGFIKALTEKPTDGVHSHN